MVNDLNKRIFSCRCTCYRLECLKERHLYMSILFLDIYLLRASCNALKGAMKMRNLLMTQIPFKNLIHVPFSLFFIDTFMGGNLCSTESNAREFFLQLFSFEFYAEKLFQFSTILLMILLGERGIFIFYRKGSCE